MVQTERKKKAIRADLKYLRDNKLSLLKAGVYSPEEWLQEQADKIAELEELQHEEQISERAMHDAMKEVVELSELLKNAVFYYEKANSDEKERIIRLVFSELTITEKALTFQCTEGFQPLEKRMLAFCDPIAWLSELARHQAYISASVQELRPLLRESPTP